MLVLAGEAKSRAKRAAGRWFASCAPTLLNAAVPLSGQYEPSPTAWVRQQVETIESSGGTKGTQLRGMPVVVVTMRGARSGKLRKVPLMRVEHAGRYALVASLGGSPNHPVWYANLLADPHVELQDGPAMGEYMAREVVAAEKREWWDRAVAAYPDYANYQARTRREIPVLVLDPIA